MECFEAGTLYHEKLPGKEKIDLVRISNSSHAQVMVYIADSVLRRAVMPGESVYMLRKAGRYLSFVPRFSVVGETLLLLENGRLCTLWENETSYLDTDIEIPVCWAHSNEYGTFIIDEKGHLDDTNAWPEQLPENRLCQSRYLVLITVCCWKMEVSTAGCPRPDGIRYSMHQSD